MGERSASSRLCGSQGDAKKAGGMPYHIALRGRFVVGEIDDPVAPRPVHRGDDDAADVIDMDAVEQLAAMFDDARAAVAKGVERAAAGP